MAAPATKTEILDVNRRYHDVAAGEYDAKWGISFGASGQEQVVGKLAKLLGAAARPVRALAGDRRRHGLLQPQHAAGRRRRRGRRARTSRRACSRRWRPTPPGSALDVETAACDAAALPFEDESFDLVFGHAVLHHLPELDALVRGVPPRAAARRDAVLRRRAVAPRRPHRRRAQARGLADLARLARRAAACPRRRTSTAIRCAAGDDHHLEGQVDVARVRPGRPRAPRARPRASAACACAARSCWRTGSAGSTARWRPARTRSGSRCRGSTTRTAATCCCRASTGACSRAACRPQLFYNLMLAAAKP